MSHLQNQNLDETIDLLQSQAHIWNHVLNYIKSMTLKFAVQLEIPEIINNHGRPMSLSELIKALPVNKEKSYLVQRVMRILVHSGFFIKQNIPKSECDEDEEECYSLTPTSRLLLNDEPLSMRQYLLASLDPILIEPWQHMTKWAKNDDPNPFMTAHGRTIFDYAGSNQNLNTFFNNAMASDSKLVTKLLIKHFGGVFQGLKSLVDVGGGTGTMAIDLANAFTHLHCINFDLPHVIAGLKGSKTVTHVGGDMFKEIPVADAVFLKWVLHNWKDEECIQILKMCKKAIPTKEKGGNGKVIVIEMVVDEIKMDKKSYETQLLFDMLMMAHINGKQRTEKQWAKIFFASGFTGYKIMQVLGLRSIIEVYP